MIKIETQVLEIPVEIGHLKYKIDVSDISINKLRKDTDLCRKKIAELEEKMENKEIKEQAGVNQLEKILIEAYAAMLGEGSFEQIYEQTPSLVSMVNYYTQLAQSLEEELTKRSNNNLPKYLQKKNKKYK